MIQLASTLEQQHSVNNEKVWRPVDYTSRTKTAAEKGYGKVEGESLGLVHGILENKMYLYGTKFTVVVDHKPLVALYSSHLRSLLMRVARHKSKVACFDFNVIYEPGAQNPADFGSRNPVSSCEVSEVEREEKGIQDGESDEEVLIHRCEELLDAVSLSVLSFYSRKDSAIKDLYSLIKKGGNISDKLRTLGYGDAFTEMSIMEDGIVLRGERFVIPKKLRKNVLQAAHEGHPGRDSILRNLR